MQLWRTPVSLYTLCQSSLASNHTDVLIGFHIFYWKPNHLISIFPSFFQVWTNPFLQWNPQDYEGIDRILVDPRTIWVPDIVLENKLVYLYFFMRGIAWDDISIQVSTLSLIHSLKLFIPDGTCVDIAWLLSNASDMRIRARKLLPCALAKWRTLYIRFVCYKWLNPVEISRQDIRPQSNVATLPCLEIWPALHSMFDPTPLALSSLFFGRWLLASLFSTSHFSTTHLETLTDLEKSSNLRRLVQ